jgi:ATP-dependent Lhr-like helicase
MLARIHRLAIGRLRREIEPVSPAAMNRFFFRWQRVARGSQAIGAEGLARVSSSCRASRARRAPGRRRILPARLHGYETEWLDMLCLSARSPGPAFARTSAANGKSARPAPHRSRS